jgi:MFS family permease
MGDKKGRLSVLFGSILLYSVANFITGYVQTVNQYALLRFIAGLGLAGELGAGITLVSELLPKEKRGLGTSLVAGIGLSGAVAAYFVFKGTDGDWRLCYKIGGVLGILLLLMRISVAESAMFKKITSAEISRGNFLMFFNNKKRFTKYALAILIGLPTWYVIGILVNQSNKFAEAMFGSKTVDSGRSIMFAYIAVSIGDIFSGLVSHWLKSRKLAIIFFYLVTIVALLLFFSPANDSDTRMYMFCGMLGFGTGFWAIFVTMGAEQFGTNLRATAATTIPNMVRGALPFINLLFLDVFQKSWHWDIQKAAVYTGLIVMGVSFTAIFLTEETFHKDLDYEEVHEVIP